MVRPPGPGDPQTVAGYAISSVIGAGGEGKVFLARSPAGRAVAIKVIRTGIAGVEASRFRRVADAAARLTGPGVVPILDFGVGTSFAYLVMPYVPGPSLQEAVAEEGPLPGPRVALLLAEVAEGLATLHAAGLLHQDLKPANVLLSADGAKLVDFALPPVEDQSPLTTSMEVGDGTYLAPEQVGGARTGPPADVFALANTMVFAATGRNAFGDGRAHVMLLRILHEEPDLRGCPPELVDLLAKCLDKDPGARPALPEIIERARELAAGSADAASAEPAGPSRAAPAASGRRGGRDHLARYRRPAWTGHDAPAAAGGAWRSLSRSPSPLAWAFAVFIALALLVLVLGSPWYLAGLAAGSVPLAGAELLAARRRKARSQVRAARSLLAAQRWAEAAPLLRGAAARLPAGERLSARGDLAVALHGLGRLAEAEAELRAVVAEAERAGHPDLATARANLAAVLAEAGRAPEAWAELPATSMDEAPAIRVVRGTVLNALGRSSDAVVQFDAALFTSGPDGLVRVPALVGAA